MPRFSRCLLATLALGCLAPDRCDGNDRHWVAAHENVGGKLYAAMSSSPAVPARQVSTSAHYRSNGLAWSSEAGWEDTSSLTALGVWLSFGALTAPLWLPVAATDDDLQFDCHFQRYPYHVTPGTVVRPGDPPGGIAGYETLATELDENRGWLCRGPFKPRLRRWSGRLSAEYAGDLDDLDRIGGRFMLNTASRFGLDTEMRYLEERLSDGRADQLWLGDGNVIFRFAQSTWSEWRMGLGFNWLDDRQRTGYGINFTYGVDLFPRRPWVLSVDVDWGKIGREGLIRARTTAGVLLWGLEGYIGYEYLDIGRIRCNNLVAGARVWF